MRVFIFTFNFTSRHFCFRIFVHSIILLCLNNLGDALVFDYSAYSVVMTVLTTWEDFEKAAERLYLQDPLKARYVLKYHHAAGQLEMKMTDDVVCLQYKTDAAQDVKRMERFVNNLMRHMASKDAH